MASNPLVKNNEGTMDGFLDTEQVQPVWSRKEGGDGNDSEDEGLLRENRGSIASRMSGHRLSQTEFENSPHKSPAEINPEEAKHAILQSRGKFFTVTFVKKSDGSLRTMNCTLNMQSKLVGGKPNLQKDYQIAVVDTAKNAIRSFDIRTLTSLNINQKRYLVK